MSLDLGTPENGCLLLADISGYTEYMGSTELMHSQDVIADLLETIVAAIEPTFQLSKLEGDAAFAYASVHSISPSMMLDTVESAYFAFQERLRDIVHATTCPCDACIRIPDLDLKFFVHDGQYVVRRIARSEELTGPDVILLHRLAKGTAAEKAGTVAYAVYTKATFDAMGLEPAVLGFVPHSEHFDDVGDIDVFIQDLSMRWAFEQERNRDFVTSAQTIHEASFDTPAPPAMVWDYLTDPDKRLLWQKAVTEVIAVTEGRRGVGSVNHCMHGPDVIVEHVSDWRPFSYITLRYDIAGVDGWPWTYQITASDDLTHVSMRISDPGDDTWQMVGGDMVEGVDVNARHLSEVLESAAAEASAAAPS
jgi:uncharacterized protein YndB with AHSA1/START domain